MPQAGEIRSNMKRVECSYDEELPTPVVENPLPYTDSSCQELIEAEARAYEENYRAHAAERWEGQERWQGRENEEMRLVNIWHPHEVFRKLQDAGIDCSIEPAVVWCWGADPKTGLLIPVQHPRSSARFWLHDAVIQDRVGISAWVWRDGQRVAQYMTYLQYPRGPEWSIMRFNEYNVPTCEKYRGWRTAILKLVLEGVLDEREADRAFGRPVVNEASELYFQQLTEYHDKRAGM